MAVKNKFCPCHFPDYATSYKQFSLFQESIEVAETFEPSRGCRVRREVQRQSQKGSIRRQKGGRRKQCSGKVRFGQVRLGQVRLGQVRLGQDSLNNNLKSKSKRFVQFVDRKEVVDSNVQVRLGKVRLSQDRLGQKRLGQVRLGQDRLVQRQSQKGSVCRQKGGRRQQFSGKVRLGYLRLGKVRLMTKSKRFGSSTERRSSIAIFK